MDKTNPRPNGSIQGDNTPMPNRGTSTGFDGAGNYGADTSEKAINRQGGIGSATKSNPPEMNPGCNNK